MLLPPLLNMCAYADMKKESVNLKKEKAILKNSPLQSRTAAAATLP